MHPQFSAHFFSKGCVNPTRIIKNGGYFLSRSQCYKEFSEFKAVKSTYKRGTIPLWTMQQGIQLFESTEKHILIELEALFMLWMWEEVCTNRRTWITWESSHWRKAISLSHMPQEFWTKRRTSTSCEYPHWKENVSVLCMQQVICQCWGVWNAETIYML